MKGGSYFPSALNRELTVFLYPIESCSDYVFFLCFCRIVRMYSISSMQPSPNTSIGFDGNTAATVKPVKRGVLRGISELVLYMANKWRGRKILNCTDDKVVARKALGYGNCVVPETTSSGRELEVRNEGRRWLSQKVYYVPLYFGIYFTIYIGYLILKSIARHKIKIPPAAADNFLLFR